VRFTRRTVRGVLGLSDTQLRVHLERLVALEYVLAHAGKQGQLYAYSLRFDGDADTTQAQLAGIGMALTEPVDAPTSRGGSGTSRGSEGNFAPGSRAGRGGVAAPSRGPESSKNAEEIAPDRATVAVAAQKPQNRKVNGHAAADH
jgi:hypothetical protein